MIDLTCPECGDETEVDRADLEGAATIECEGCGAEFPFELNGTVLTLGAALDEEEDVDDDTLIELEGEYEEDEGEEEDNV